MKHIIFWFNVCSIIKVFSPISTFVNMICGLEEDHAFNYISPIVLWLSGVLRLQTAGGKMKLEGRVKAIVRKSAVSV